VDLLGEVKETLVLARRPRRGVGLNAGISSSHQIHKLERRRGPPEAELVGLAIGGELHVVGQLRDREPPQRGQPSSYAYLHGQWIRTENPTLTG